MLPSSAIKAFLSRKRQDWRVVKTWPLERLEQKLAELPVRPPIWSKYRKHQKVCFLIGARLKRFAFLLDTGMGKTMLSIGLARYFEQAEQGDRFLVLVPNRSNKDEWAREIEKHSPRASFKVLTGGSENKWKQLEEEDTLFTIETYSGLVRMVCGKVNGKKGRKRLKPNPKLVQALLDRFDGVFLDESTSVKNPRSLPYRICKKMSESFPIFFALTGTPFGRDPMDLWSQMHLIDHGETLGETIGLFRAAFFKEKPGAFGVKYEFDGKKDEELNRILAHRSIRYEIDDGDLPKLVPVYKYVDLPDETLAYYKKAKSDLIAANGDYTITKNVFMRMRQLSSGFLGVTDDETGEKAKIVFDDNPKLDLLMSILDTIVDHHKVIVFHDFVVSGDWICEELEEMKIGFVRLDGRTKDTKAVLHEFDKKDKTRVIVLNNAAGGFGLNLQVARYGIYYESPVPVITRRQTQRRYERQYSKHETVFSYDLICRDTADEKILRYHKEGGDLFKAIIEGRERL